MTPEQEAAIREQHRATPYFTPDDHTGEACTNDGTEWPCDASLLLAELDAARAELAMCEPSDAEATAEVARLNAANARLRVALELCIPVFDVLALIDPLHSTRIADTLRAALKEKP